MLFWIDAEGKPHAVEHQELGSLLKSSELLRKNGMRFVCSATENLDSVGKPGVDYAGSDYEWYKRRPDPKIPLGRKRDEKT